MTIRRLFALGASAGLVACQKAVFCAPKAPKREGVDDQGRLRYQSEHEKIFGAGFHHDVFWKAKILQMYENCETFYEERQARKKMPTLNDFYHQITGFHRQRASEYWYEKEANDGFLLPPDQRGRQIYMLEKDYPDFENWVDSQALQAMSGYLTVENLLPKFQQEFGVIVSYHVLRKALVRLDFKYQKSMIGAIMSHKEKGILEHWNMHPDIGAWSMRFSCCGAYCYGLFCFKNFF